MTLSTVVYVCLQVSKDDKQVKLVWNNTKQEIRVDVEVSQPAVAVLASKGATVVEGRDAADCD
jgi:hypothetical protein